MILCFKKAGIFPKETNITCGNEKKGKIKNLVNELYKIRDKAEKMAKEITMYSEIK